MNPFAVLARHLDPAGRAYSILVTHSVLVARKARDIAIAYSARARGSMLDLEFITEAALLHDVGIARCHAPELDCRGSSPYIQHGIEGRAILEEEGLHRHALVCERHTGAGITAQEVRAQGLPLPERDYLPLSLEEKVICIADKFYSKKPEKLWREKGLSAIARSLAKWGPDVERRWEALRSEVLG